MLGSREEDFNAFSVHDLYGHTLAQEPLLRERFMTFIILVAPFFVICHIV